MSHAATADPTVAHVHDDVLARCDNLFRRARDAGLLRADVDLVWARRVYYALVEASHENDGDEDPDALATAIVHTLLHGIGTDIAQL